MKTIEQAAAEYALKTGFHGDKETFVAGTAFARRWISIKEELPEAISGFIRQSFYVLIKTDVDFIRIACYCHKKKSWLTIESELQKPLSKNLGEVTHWRPIEVK